MSLASSLNCVPGSGNTVLGVGAALEPGRGLVVLSEFCWHGFGAVIFLCVLTDSGNMTVMRSLELH